LSLACFSRRKLSRDSKRSVPSVRGCSRPPDSRPAATGLAAEPLSWYSMLVLRSRRYRLPSREYSSSTHSSRLRAAPSSRNVSASEDAAAPPARRPARGAEDEAAKLESESPKSFEALKLETMVESPLDGVMPVWISIFATRRA